MSEEAKGLQPEANLRELVKLPPVAEHENRYLGTLMPWVLPVPMSSPSPAGRAPFRCERATPSVSSCQKGQPHRRTRVRIAAQRRGASAHGDHDLG